MKKIIVLATFVLLSTLLQAQDLSHCAPVTKKMGEGCGNTATSMKLEINNQCKQVVNARACFETTAKQWECETDNIFHDEGVYIFSHCNTTGQYRLDLCSVVKGKATCGSAASVTTPYASLTCSNGKTLEYSIKPYQKGLFRITTKSGGQAAIKVRKDKSKAHHYISVDDISMVLCSEPAEPSMIQKLIPVVRDLVTTSEAKWFKECETQHHPDWCANEYKRKLELDSLRRGKMAAIGVRG